MNDEMDITNACEKHVVSKDKIHKTMREVYNNFVLEPGVVLYCYQIAKQLFFSTKSTELFQFANVWS